MHSDPMEAELLQHTLELERLYCGYLYKDGQLCRKRLLIGTAPHGDRAGTRDQVAWPEQLRKRTSHYQRCRTT